MSADGSWNITLQTPMGAQTSTIELVTDGNSLTGTQSGNGETSPIYEGRIEGDTATWKVNITRPMALSVSFSAKIDGDSISGTAKAGIFPKSSFSGSRA